MLLLSLQTFVQHSLGFVGNIISTNRVIVKSRCHGWRFQVYSPAFRYIICIVHFHHFALKGGLCRWICETNVYQPTSCSSSHWVATDCYISNFLARRTCSSFLLVHLLSTPNCSRKIKVLYASSKA